ncbi:MAG: hypothetical protein PHT00_00565 [Candidatus Methanomethylophilus sp.]|nr:hypothetical protein [Methanomethylophilus sp.]MDD4222893.1 hypothetical protein [Methanomethylophilus sp.]MDD4668523.1 hypothetical protein [Methanomethylophilus sp.]
MDRDRHQKPRRRHICSVGTATVNPVNCPNRWRLLSGTYNGTAVISVYNN